MAVPVVPVGTFIAGRYEVLEYLGSGGYGEVYRVRDHHLNTVVALKLIRNFVGPTPWGEGQLLRQLHSQYILPVLNADHDAGVPYLVTELAVHGSAEVPMDPMGVAPNQAVRWVRHACRGAARMHDGGLLHRDIKPHNLFLTAAGEAQLGDPGLAAVMNANGEAPSLGTLITRAPEVSAGGNTNVRSEVYSLGAMLYALLSGKYSNQVGDPPIRDVAPHISQALAQRVMKAIAPDPSDRYASPLEFDAALGDLPSPVRHWRRTDEHAGHTACFRGECPGMTDATVCLVPSGTRAEVVSMHQPSGRLIRAACRGPAPPSAQVRNLRAAIAKVP